MKRRNYVWAWRGEIGKWPGWRLEGGAHAGQWHVGVAFENSPDFFVQVSIGPLWFAVHFPSGGAS